MDPDHRPSYVCAYVNPDTDGISCSVAYHELRSLQDGSQFLPALWGQLNKETLLVLAEARITAPEHGFHQGAPAAVALVDTHHVAQLAPEIDPVNVVEIIDHHPAGDTDAFPNAVIENADVGAAATLLVERFRRLDLRPSSAVAFVLSAAIVSNTLNFAAPSSSERDREALGWLAPLADLPDEFVRRMFLALSDFAHRGTGEVLAESYKRFQAGGVDFGACQVETVESAAFLGRRDLRSCLEQVTARTRLGCLSVIDLLEGTTTVIATSAESERALEDAGLAFDAHGVAVADRVLLRKTDLVPAFSRYADRFLASS